MGYYQSNPACGCGRCSTRGLMGPAVLITLGILFLLSNMSEWGFERTWPILLVVIGAIKVVRYVMTDNGHVNPGPYPPPPYGAPGGPNPGYAPPSQNNVAPVSGTPATEPTPASAPMLGDGGEGEVHNG